MSNNPAAPQGRPTGLQDRLQTLTSKVNTPMACVCGSTHFYVVRTAEYADNGYASAQIRVLSQNEEPMHLCVCGRPVTLKDTSAASKNNDGPRARFLKSLQAAIAYQNSTNLQEIAKGFVSIQEHDNTKATIDELRAQVDWLTSVVDVLSGENAGDEAETETESETQQAPEAKVTEPEAVKQPEPVVAKPVASEKPAKEPNQRTGRPQSRG